MRGHRIRGTALRATRAAAIRNSLGIGIRPARKLSGDKLPSMATEHDVEDDPELSAPGKLAKNRRCKSPTGKV
jgi:hypothetical protein